MPGKSSNLGQFWQELKRRKVVRVITVYAAASFVILELVSIIAEPFGLPAWTLKFVFILLCIGFIIAVILSWIYDITPVGIEKTKPVHKVEKEDKPVTSNSWRIASYISFVVIVALIVFNIVSTSNRSKEISILDKSIAVLPFKYLSDESEKQYLADGTMDAILLHLSKIEDLRVMARTSVEQYRETDKTATVICQELDVSYVLEGSFQKYGDQARLIVQLIEPGKEGHVWANEYDRDWKDIFSVQSEVAQTIARELHAVITPEEKQRIEKTPTANLTAYDFYQRGVDENNKYVLDIDNREALERAEDLYHKALEYDSTFALAYTGLARVYKNKQARNTYFSENFLDSVMILADIALSFDDQLAQAYTVKGSYYREKGLTEQAVKEYDKAIKFNPNDWEAYHGKGWLYYYDDHVKAIDNLQKAASLNHGSFLPYLIRLIGYQYYHAGFNEKSKYYIQEALKLDGDSIEYYYGLFWPEFSSGNPEKANEFLKKGYAIDSNNATILIDLGFNYMFSGQHKESLKYIEKYIERMKAFERLEINFIYYYFGYIYWQNGYKEEAEHYFNETIIQLNRMIELGRAYVQQYSVYYDLAAVYAFMGERDKAYENLNIFNQKQRMDIGDVQIIKNDPLFDSIRDEPEFQQIVRDVESKYHAEHERVRKWLEEQDML